MDRFHNQKCNHLIYAILWEDDGDKCVYVGKTITTDTKAVLRRHLRGELAITASQLGHNDWDGKPPHIVVLHSLVCTGADAFRYILCYYRLYDDFGFTTVAHRKTENYVYDMHSFTENLYHELQKTVTREHLLVGITIEKNVTEKPVSENKKEHRIQLNIRVNEHVLYAFLRFCNKLGITQREGFIHLMHCADPENLSNNPLFVEQKETIEQQKKRINELETKLREEGRGQKADAKLKSSIANIKHLVAQYIAVVVEVPSEPLLKKPGHKSHEKSREHQYPDSAGDTVLELEDLYYSFGRCPAAFLCGRDLKNGKKIKLRYYPKAEYVGCLPGGKYCAEKAQWLVSYQYAADGAMELVAAFPLPTYIEEKQTEQPCSPSSIKSLDEIIQKASTYI